MDVCSGICMYMHSELPVMRRAPVIRSRNATSLTVRWRAWMNAPGSGMGPVIGYIVYYRSRNNSDWKHMPQTRSRTLMMTGLTSGQSYEVRVSAVHRTGLVGPRSPPAEAATCGSRCWNNWVHCSGRCSFPTVLGHCQLYDRKDTGPVTTMLQLYLPLMGSRAVMHHNSFVDIGTI